MLCYVFLRKSPKVLDKIAHRVHIFKVLDLKQVILFVVLVVDSLEVGFIDVDVFVQLVKLLDGLVRRNLHLVALNLDELLKRVDVLYELFIRLYGLAVLKKRDLLTLIILQVIDVYLVVKLLNLLAHHVDVLLAKVDFLCKRNAHLAVQQIPQNLQTLLDDQVGVMVYKFFLIQKLFEPLRLDLIYVLTPLFPLLARLIDPPIFLVQLHEQRQIFNIHDEVLQVVDKVANVDNQFVVHLILAEIQRKNQHSLYIRVY